MMMKGERSNLMRITRKVTRRPRRDPSRKEQSVQGITSGIP
jgi:hypothetical protein